MISNILLSQPVARLWMNYSTPLKYGDTSWVINVRLSNLDTVAGVQARFTFTKGISINYISTPNSEHYWTWNQKVNDSSFNITFNVVGDSVRNFNISPHVWDSITFMSLVLSVKPDSLIAGYPTFTMTNVVVGGPGARVLTNQVTNMTVNIPAKEVSGDLDSNGVVTVSDIILLMRISCGVTPSPYQLRVGDLNNDGTINVLDVILLVERMQVVSLMNLRKISGNTVQVEAACAVAIYGSNLTGIQKGYLADKIELHGDSCIVVTFNGYYDGPIELNQGSVIDIGRSFQISNKTMVKVTEEKAIPNYKLSQNYPNPFNPATTISYSLPKNDFVNLKIYNLLGQEIRSLINRSQTAGNYSIQFDAAGLPSGVYLYRLQTSLFSETKKMSLMK